MRLPFPARGAVIGVELGVDVVRAVRVQRSGSCRACEVAWDARQPAAAVTALRSQLGPARRIALSVGLGFLHVKQVKLPPLSAAERRSIIALEPDRFFPVQNESVVVSLGPEEDLAYAVDAELVERWIHAFQSWAPVECVEPAPRSLARAVRGRSGWYSMPAAHDELGIVQVEDGRARSTRRMPAGTELPAEVQPLPPLGSGPGELHTALGAARGLDGALEAMLLPDPAARALQRGRVQRLALATLTCLATIVLALAAVDGMRARTLARIQSELVALAPAAQPAMLLRERLAALERETAALEQLRQQRPDPLITLAALSRHLPADANVVSVRARGADWQVDGTAADAAALLPLLDRDDHFEDVRFLSASTRFRDGNRMRETFSIAFRVRLPA